MEEIIQCVHRLGGDIYSKYDVVEENGQSFYAYTVDITKKFPTGEIHHYRAWHNNCMIAYQHCLDKLVKDIENFDHHHKGYW